jgi:hypothetical protein
MLKRFAESIRPEDVSPVCLNQVFILV